jgi:hypothetical protein
MQWSAIPSQIISGHHWITIFTAVHARQLVAHHREYDFPLGLRP